MSITNPLCNHPLPPAPPVHGCTACRAYRDGQRNAAMTILPPSLGVLSPPKTRDGISVSYCASKKEWCWEVWEKGMLVAKDGEVTESEAWVAAKEVLTLRGGTMRPPPIWAVGVTAVPSRIKNHLSVTLASLHRAGFPEPRLFMDGGDTASYVPVGPADGVTFRFPHVGAFGNFALGLWELIVRKPAAHRYVMFQDDILCCSNLRAYLDGCPYPEKGYWNLYTAGACEDVVRGRPDGWVRGAPLDPNRPDGILQKGQGALGLVFDRDAALALLSHPSFVRKPVSVERPRDNVDGGVVTALNLSGYSEYVHNPSLIQHTGIESAVKPGKVWRTEAMSFRGESWDPTGLIQARESM